MTNEHHEGYSSSQIVDLSSGTIPLPYADCYFGGRITTMKSDTDDERIGQRLAELEKALGLNGNKMAAALGITRQRWSNYKSGQRRLPLGVSYEIKRIFGASMDWILTGEEDSNRPALRRQLDELRARGRSAKTPR